MTTFIDTSAFYAILDAADRRHLQAKETWQTVVSTDEALFCSNYILVETFALLQKRLGMQAVRVFQEDIVPLVAVLWLDVELHAQAVQAMLVAGRKELSLVDCSSFTVMRKAGIGTVFAFDRHFAEQGFTCIPAVSPDLDER